MGCVWPVEGNDRRVFNFLQPFGMAWQGNLAEAGIAVVGRVPLQGPAWACVFCGSRLMLEFFLLLVFKIPFDLVVMVPDLSRTGTQPSAVLFLITTINLGLPWSILWLLWSPFLGNAAIRYTSHGSVAQGSCAHVWLHGRTLDSGDYFVFSLPLEPQGNSGWRGHHGITGSSQVLTEGPA